MCGVEFPRVEGNQTLFAADFHDAREILEARPEQTRSDRADHDQEDGREDQWIAVPTGPGGQSFACRLRDFDHSRLRRHRRPFSSPRAGVIAGGGPGEGFDEVVRCDPRSPASGDRGLCRGVLLSRLAAVFALTGGGVAGSSGVTSSHSTSPSTSGSSIW